MYFASKLLFSWNLNSVEFKTFIDYLEQEKSRKMQWNTKIAL